MQTAMYVDVFSSPLHTLHTYDAMFTWDLVNVSGVTCHLSISFSSSCSDALVSKLTETKNQVIEREGILATKLCTHKENVNQINEIHLSKLPGDKKVFEASDSDSGMRAMLDSQVPVRQTLELKVGAQVTHHIHAM